MKQWITLGAVSVCIYTRTTKAFNVFDLCLFDLPFFLLILRECLF